MEKLKIVGIVAVLLILAVLVGTAQAATEVTAPEEEWNRTLGNWCYICSAQQASDGGYIIAGYTYSRTGSKTDIWLIKTDSQGNEQWSRTVGGSDDEDAYKVQQTSDGGYIITGYTYSYGAGDSDVWLIKVDSNGNEIWNKTFGGSNLDEGYSVAETSDGGYIIAGCCAGQIWVIKTDFQGNREWDRLFGGPKGEYAYAVQQTSDGGYIVAGWTKSYGTSCGECEYGVNWRNAWCIKLDSNGTIEWDRTFGGPKWDEAHSIQQTLDGGYIIAGYTHSYGAGFGDVWLIKTDSQGNEQWSRTFGGSDKDGAYKVQQTLDGGYIIAGSTESYGAGGGTAAWLIKTDSQGNGQWDRTFGGSNYKHDIAYSVQQTSDGGYIIAGHTVYGSGRGTDHAWLIKLAPEPQTPTETITSTITPAKRIIERPTTTQATKDTPEIPAGEERGIPGFEGIFAIGWLLAVAYVLRRRSK